MNNFILESENFFEEGGGIMPTPIKEFIRRMGLDQGNLNSNIEGLYLDMLKSARLIQVVPLPDLSKTIKIILI